MKSPIIMGEAAISRAGHHLPPWKMPPRRRSPAHASLSELFSAKRIDFRAASGAEIVHRIDCSAIEHLAQLEEGRIALRIEPQARRVAGLPQMVGRTITATFQECRWAVPISLRSRPQSARRLHQVPFRATLRGHLEIRSPPTRLRRGRRTARRSVAVCIC